MARGALRRLICQLRAQVERLAKIRLEYAITANGLHRVVRVINNERRRKTRENKGV